MSTYSFWSIKGWSWFPSFPVVPYSWDLWRLRWTLLMTSSASYVIGGTSTIALLFMSLLWKSSWEPCHLCEIAPHCVSIFPQSLQERSRHGLCRTQRCYEWKPTARQRWTRTPDLDSATAVRLAATSGPCSPATLCHPWVFSALRRTSWVKVKILVTFMFAGACTSWIIPHFHAIKSSLTERSTFTLKGHSTSNLSSLMCIPEYQIQAVALFCLKSFLFNQSRNSVCKHTQPLKLTWHCSHLQK